MRGNIGRPKNTNGPTETRTNEAVMTTPSHKASNEAQGANTKEGKTRTARRKAQGAPKQIQGGGTNDPDWGEDDIAMRSDYTSETGFMYYCVLHALQVRAEEEKNKRKAQG